MSHSGPPRSNSNRDRLKPILHSSSRSRGSSQDSERTESSTNTDKSRDSMGRRDPDSGERVTHYRVPDHSSHVVTTTSSTNSRGKTILVHDQKKGRKDHENLTTGHAQDKDYTKSKRREEKERREYKEAKARKN